MRIAALGIFFFGFSTWATNSWRRRSRLRVSAVQEARRRTLSVKVALAEAFLDSTWLQTSTTPTTSPPAAQTMNPSHKPAARHRLNHESSAQLAPPAPLIAHHTRAQQPSTTIAGSAGSTTNDPTDHPYGGHQLHQPEPLLCHPCHRQFTQRHSQ